MKEFEKRNSYENNDNDNEEISKIHFVFMADVSGSMKDPYNNN